MCAADSALCRGQGCAAAESDGRSPARSRVTPQMQWHCRHTVGRTGRLQWPGMDTQSAGSGGACRRMPAAGTAGPAGLQAAMRSTASGRGGRRGRDQAGRLAGLRSPRRHRTSVSLCRPTGRSRVAAAVWSVYLYLYTCPVPTYQRSMSAHRVSECSVASLHSDNYVRPAVHCTVYTDVTVITRLRLSARLCPSIMAVAGFCQ